MVLLGFARLKRTILKVRLGLLLRLVVAALFLLSATATVILTWQHMRQQALEEAEEKARIILDHNLATHTYFSHQLKPALFDKLGAANDERYFDPVWMSSTYAVREIDTYFKGLGSSDYSYKECAINARSPENEADSFERAFIEELNRDASLVERSLIRNLNGESTFVTLRRGEVMETTCLRCHSTPTTAPADLVAVYGSERSFGREAGEVVSAIAIHVPLTEAYANADRFASRLSLLLATVFLVLYAAQMWITRRLFFRPLDAIRHKAARIASDPMRLGEEIPLPLGEELRDLTQSLNNMSHALGENQEKLLRWQKLVLLGQLSGGVAHELRNPLGNIRNSAYLLRLETDAADPAIGNVLDILDQEIIRSESIIHSLLNFARTGVPDRRWVDVNYVIAQTLELVRIPDKVVVETHLAETLLPLWADQQHLERVFQNLIDNAIESMPEGGRLRVDTTSSRPDVPSKPSELHIRISDTGTGIPANRLGQVFEPLFSTRSGGIGLGLALVRVLVEAHGGYIHLTSVVGQGTTFMVSLPIDTPFVTEEAV